MKSQPDSYFLKMIQTLRCHEEVVLFNNLLEFSPADEEAVLSFLKEEYDRESFDHPHQTPPFHAAAAGWAAKIVYVAAQLILYRKHQEKDLPSLLPPFSVTPDAAAILSADLCLRFVPDMIATLKLIDTDDRLISLLATILNQWHFSAVRYHLDGESLDFAPIASNPCLHQLYCQRIVDHRNLALAQHPFFKNAIASQLGLYVAEFWNEFKHDTTPS